MFLLASVRTEVADYLSAVLDVYTLLIVLYILTQWLFAFGIRPGYSRYTDAIFNFLRDICEPFLAIFRRVMPRLGPLDLSPIIAILALQLFNSFVVGRLIHG